MVRKTLSQQTADRILKFIMESGEIRPGDKLPGENILAHRFDVSRGTLREAIWILASQGVLEVHRGKGSYVSSKLKLSGNYGLNQAEFIRVQLKDLFETRMLVEPESAAITCRRASDEEIAHILDLGDRVAHAIYVGGDRTAADQEFHSAIVSASHNAFLRQLEPIISRAIANAILTKTEVELLAKETLQDHATLMDFLKKRDAGGAKQAMSIHLRHAIVTLGLNSGDEPIF